ncbi:MAG: hypothetical protein ABH833_04340 [Parcubacteria group bacterium]
MNKQKDLEGNETDVQKETVKKLTTKYVADYFIISVSETGQDQIDKLNEEKDITGKRRWIAKNMKVKDPKLLRSESEGEQFQNDLDKLIKVL